MQPREMPGTGESSPLLRHEGEESQDERQHLEFSKDDDENPRTWSKSKKFANIAVIASISVLSPLGSSMFAPGIKQIAKSLGTTENGVIGCQTGFVCMLGIGPLILAPLSETFGRKKLYIICFGCFTLLQIPTALAKSLPLLIVLRTLAGFFGSVGVANGGGTISDMYEPRERAGVLGIYLLGPLLGPNLGPLLGGIILQNLEWPWLFWVLLVICSVAVVSAFFFLRETYVPVLLEARKQALEQKTGGKYTYDGQDDRPFRAKFLQAIRRPLKILFTQPIVLTMSAYQALIFATTYSLYTQFPSIYGDDYGFSTLQIGLVYLGPGMGFLFAVWALIPRIDTIFNSLTKNNNGESKAEFRLPLANIGAVLTPISLFWFAWTVEYHVHWTASVAATFVYGIGQVTIFNTVQNYYIDSFEKYAASAIAAGALFRSIIGGIVPLFTPSLLDKLGVGWGMSIFAFIGLILAPSPLVFYYYGEKLRKKFEVDL